jgi:hypothetical protein
MNVSKLAAKLTVPKLSCTSAKGKPQNDKAKCRNSIVFDATLFCLLAFYSGMVENLFA